MHLVHLAGCCVLVLWNVTCGVLHVCVLCLHVTLVTVTRVRYRHLCVDRAYRSLKDNKVLEERFLGAIDSLDVGSLDVDLATKKWVYEGLLKKVFHSRADRFFTNSSV